MKDIFLKSVLVAVVLMGGGSGAIAMPVPCEIDLVTGGCTNQPPIVNFTTGEGPSLSSQKDGYLLQKEWVSSLNGGILKFQDMYFDGNTIKIIYFNGINYFSWKLSLDFNTGKPVVKKGEPPMIGGSSKETRENFSKNK